MNHSRARDYMGRFVPGNRGGPGRPRREVEETYLTSMAAICNDEAWQAIVQKATQDAINGDAKARTWLSGYLLGLPTTRIEQSNNPSPEMLLSIILGDREKPEPDETTDAE